MIVEKVKSRIKLLLILISVVFVNILLAQNQIKFEYINPSPNSEYVSISSKILLRPGQELDRSSINNEILTVIGSKSGNHPGTVYLSNDSKTIIFSPYTNYQTDEDVKVTLNYGVKTSNGKSAGEISFSFHTSKNVNTLINEKPEENFVQNTIKIKKTSIVPDSSLPWNLPSIQIDQSNNPAPGYLFLCPSPYLMIIDNQGTPVFYRNVNGNIYDFDLQPNG